MIISTVRQNPQVLASNYGQYYRIVPASNDMLRNECYRLRHDVYCRELGYEPVRNNGLETDEFDARAMHWLVRTTDSNEYIACSRLVMSSPSWQQGSHLPIEQSCLQHLSPETNCFLQQNRSKVAEISRMTVSAKYRRSRPFSQSNPERGNINVPQTRRFPNLTLALYLSMLAVASENDISHLVFLTDSRIISSMAPLGLKLAQAGTPVHHRGLRSPYLLDVQENIRGMSKQINEFFQAIREDASLRIDSAFSRQ